MAVNTPKPVLTVTLTLTLTAEGSPGFLRPVANLTADGDAEMVGGLFAADDELKRAIDGFSTGVMRLVVSPAGFEPATP